MQDLPWCVEELQRICGKSRNTEGVGGVLAPVFRLQNQELG